MDIMLLAYLLVCLLFSIHRWHLNCFFFVCCYLSVGMLFSDCFGFRTGCTCVLLWVNNVTINTIETLILLFIGLVLEFSLIGDAECAAETSVLTIPG